MSNSPSQHYTQPDDRTLLDYDMTPGFKPFAVYIYDTNNRVMDVEYVVLVIFPKSFPSGVYESSVRSQHLNHEKSNRLFIF